MTPGFHEHHHHLLLGGARERLENLFLTEITDFRTFETENVRMFQTSDVCTFPRQNPAHSTSDSGNKTETGGKREAEEKTEPEKSTPTETAAAAIGRLNRWIRRFCAPLCRRPEYLKYSVQAALEQALTDGVHTLETSVGVDFSNFLPFSPCEILSEIHSVHMQTAPGIILRLDAGISRALPPEKTHRMMCDFLNADEYSLFGGIDLYDVEDAHEPEEYRKIFQEARHAGLKLKAHVGEFGAADAVRHTVETLELAEVQHGIHACESPSVMRFLAERGTVLNLSPASNFYLHAMDFRKSPHPLRIMYDSGVHFTLATDDFLLFHTSIAEQLEALAPFFSPAELREIREWCEV